MSTQPVIPAQPAVAAVVHSTDQTDPTPLVSASSPNLGDVPEYERGMASQVQMSTSKGDPAGGDAHVDFDPEDKNPKPNIVVDDSKQYTSAVQAHELQHNIQNAASGGTGDGAKGVTEAQSNAAANDNDAWQKTYGYGGTDGLAQHLASGKTVSDLNTEQQASIPQNYMKEYVKAEKSGDAKAIDKLNKVYEPAIRQLRNMANPSNTTINTTPDAPGAPPASATGVAVPVKGMLSNSTRSVALKASDVHNPPPKASAPKTVAKSGKGWYNGASALGK